MKTFILIVCSFYASAQELTLNQDNNFYEFYHVREDLSTADDFRARLRETNYKIIHDSDNEIEALGFSNHLVGGLATVEIHYLVKISFKNDRHKLTLTNFVLTDKNGSNPLEGMRGFTNRWIDIINKKLPTIINSIEKSPSQNDW